MTFIGIFSGYLFLIGLWGLFYFLGSIMLLFAAPKVWKAFINGSSVIGSAVGALAVAAAGTALAGIGVAAATGMLGNGALAKAANTITGADGNSPGSNPSSANKPGSPTAAVANAAGAQINEDAELATSAPKSQSRAAGGGVSSVIQAATASKSGASIMDAHGNVTPDATAKAAAASNATDFMQDFGVVPLESNSINPLRSAAGAFKGGGAGAIFDTSRQATAGKRAMAATKRLKDSPQLAALTQKTLDVGTALAKPTLAAVGSGGTLGGFVQAHTAMNKKSGTVLNSNNQADREVPNAL